MYTVQLRKIKRYLDILSEHRRFNVCDVNGITYCDVDYKSDNTPPPASAFRPYESGAIWGSRPLLLCQS